jgi:hypothetical protein
VSGSWRSQRPEEAIKPTSFGRFELPARLRALAIRTGPHSSAWKDFGTPFG